MGTEPADFILSSPSKLVYVHIKCDSTNAPQSAAGKLAEVCSQAIKNIEMLISGNHQLQPANKATLLNEWPSNNAPNRIQERIRIFNGTRFDNPTVSVQLREDKLNELWDVVSERRSSFLVKKEVWVVTANAFSKSDFSAQMRLGNQGRSESLQAYQLIQSYLSTSYNNDIEFKLFVSP
jgi:hypothetical protein